jgi:catechol 2,3-dioxygenase-like lactoylglutathione lyase family enzyme
LALKSAPTQRAIEVKDDIIRPTIHHVLLKTTRYEEMRDWYYATLGMTVNYEFDPSGHPPGAKGAFLSNDIAHHRLVLFSPPTVSVDAEREAHAGLHHWAYQFQSLDDLLATYTRLHKLAILPHHCVDHGPITSFYYSDPDGNLLELFVDNFEDVEDSTRFFREAPEFRADPIGPGIDPDRLVEARAQGLEPAEIHRRSYDGQYPPQEGKSDYAGVPGVGIETTRKPT